MDDQSILSNRGLLAQKLYGLSGRQLTRFRELFPTPIFDWQVEAALALVKGYPQADPDPKYQFTLPKQQQRKAKKKMRPL